MSQSITATKDRLTEDFKAVVVETEQLLQSAASIGNEKMSDLRASLEQSLVAAREQMHQLQAAATEQTLSAAHATDHYVHENPWKSMGIVAGVSMALGALIGLSLNRR